MSHHDNFTPIHAVGRRHTKLGHVEGEHVGGDGGEAQTAQRQDHVAEAVLQRTRVRHRGGVERLSTMVFWKEKITRYI